VHRKFRQIPAFSGRFPGIFVFAVLLVLMRPAAGEDLLAHTDRVAKVPIAGDAPGPGIEDTSPLPPVLGPEDARLYREIFALQEGGKWKAANERIDRLDDRVMLGHVMAQRYLHPTAYRSKYRELKAWLADYADHPQAKRIHRLAKKRRPSTAAAPRAPERIRMRLGAFPEVAPHQSTKKLTKAERHRAREIKRQVRRNVLRTRLTVTEKLLNGPEARRLLDHVEIDEGRGQVAAAWFYYGKPEKAHRLAAQAAARSGRRVPLALWIAGLSAWRLDRLEEAAGYFEALAQSEFASVWNQSAGAYWAARTHLRLRNPGDVSYWLAIAADTPRTFYGLLARRAMGIRIAFPARAKALSKAESKTLLADPAARRSLALLEVGQRERAESELRRLDGDGDALLAGALLKLNERAGFPALAMRLARGLDGDRGRWTGGGLETGLYPIPPWQPDKGFRIDRALIYAMMRQESGFDPGAKSPDGARGLMQILPSTANYVLRERRFRGKSRSKLFDPQVNIDLGQRYIAHLLRYDVVDGDLFRLAAAYNGGPGNLSKWLRGMGEVNDPLMFIESLPSRETRLFIERVLANLWIYRARLGQDLPSLDAIAAGDWPAYTSQDRPIQAAARPQVPGEGSNKHGAD
jgi:soluble lytic murein transglycosylase-like protein